MVAKNLMPYIGSKCRMLKFLNAIFDDLPHTCFVDVFGGSGTVTLNKKTSKVDVLNDINKNIYTLYKILRDDEKSSELHEKLQLTCYSRTEWNYAKEVCASGENIDEIERARCTFVLYNESFSGNSDCYGCDTTVSKAVRSMKSKVSQLPAFHNRIKNVYVENLDFRDIFKRYDRSTALFYLDPPYHPATRKGLRYPCEMDESQHCALLDCLLSCRGACVLSGYDNPVYASVLKGIEKRTFETFSSISSKAKCRNQRIECVWIKRAKSEEK